jgi:hypothetical protein
MKPTNGHGGGLTKGLLRREVIEASELFQTLRGLAINPVSGISMLPSEARLAQDLIEMSKWDLCEAMTAYLNERNKTSATKKGRDEKRALLLRFCNFLSAKGSLRRDGVASYEMDDFITKDVGDQSTLGQD